jgi:hypothetical protein
VLAVATSAAAGLGALLSGIAAILTVMLTIRQNQQPKAAVTNTGRGERLKPIRTTDDDGDDQRQAESTPPHDVPYPWEGLGAGQTTLKYSPVTWLGSGDGPLSVRAR